VAKQIGYRELKKLLNKFHKFSFKTPRKGKDFTPQQKSAITKQFNKLQDVIKDNIKERNTFIPYPKHSKLKDVDGIRTNKGIFYKYPGARVDIVKGRTILKVYYKKIKEIFLPFPDGLGLNLENVKIWVSKLEQLLKPDYITWSVNGYRGQAAFEPEQFELYIDYNNEEETELSESLREAEKPFFNGVFFVIRHTNKRYFRDIDVSNALAAANKMVREWL
jgi:hypothetical protein